VAAIVARLGLGIPNLYVVLLQKELLEPASLYHIVAHAAVLHLSIQTGDGVLTLRGLDGLSQHKLVHFGLHRVPRRQPRLMVLEAQECHLSFEC
jgi:hypothetical protein